MTSPVGVVDFFVVEGTEYIERLDLLVSSASSTGPESKPFLQYARSLRGSATMAKQYSIARVGAALEQVGRALRDGKLRWDPAVNAVIISSIENLKILMRNVRSLTPDDEERVQARLAELDRLAPSGPRSPLTPSSASSSTFLVTGTADLADALDALVAAPDDAEALAIVLEQARALRGVALVRELAPLAEVVDALEHLAQATTLGAPIGTRQLSLFSASAGVLRRASGELATGRRPDVGSPEAKRFAGALAMIGEASTVTTTPRERVVAISELFYDDGGQTVVHASSAPPTRPADRFRLEVVSHAEHVRRVVGDARNARDASGRERYVRELRSALDTLRESAESFGERSLAGFVAAWGERTFAVDSTALDALDQTALLLADPTTKSDALVARLAELDPAAAPARRRGDRRERSLTPSGHELRVILDEGIAGIDRLEQQPLSEPAHIPEEDVVDIDTLLYRGDAAMERARSLREEMRVGAQPPSGDAVAELLDLLDLATTG